MLNHTTVPRQVPRPISKTEVPPGARTPGGTVDQGKLLSFFPPVVYTKNAAYTRGNYYQSTEVEQLPPSLVDSLTTFQVLHESELTYLLMMSPREVLKLAGDYLPELGMRERSFWQLVKRSIPSNLSELDPFIYLHNLAEKNGFGRDFKTWSKLYYEYQSTFDCLSESACSIDRARVLLKEIVAAHEARVNLEVVQKSSRFRSMEAYYA